MKGVHDIVLMPEHPGHGVGDRLKQELRAASTLRAGVGYWTIHHKQFDWLADRLSHDGFLCVDLSLPTSVDRLLELDKANANIHLHLEMATAASDWEGWVPQMPRGLMHTKMLLFDRPDGTASLWCGSHNWSTRGLGGLNIEASLVIHLDQGSPLYEAARTYLEAIRDRFCLPFDPKLAKWYRWLQKNRNDPTQPVLRIRSRNPAGHTGQSITLFGDRIADLKTIPKVTDPLLVKVIHPTSGDSVVYDADVLEKGKLEAADSAAGGLTFGPRHHAFRKGRKVPYLVERRSPDVKRVRDAAFYATVHVLEQRPKGTDTEPPDDRPRWMRDEFQSRVDLRVLDDWYVEGLMEARRRKETGTAATTGAGHANAAPDPDTVRARLQSLLKVPAQQAHFLAESPAFAPSTLDDADLIVKHVVVNEDEE